MVKILLALSLLVPCLFHLTNNEISFTSFIRNDNGSDVFNYLSNPENFPTLNPTIYKIKVVRGKGNEFYVEYEECLSHFPIITNFGLARYEVMEKEDGRREMISNHETCFIGNYLCLPTFARVQINIHKLYGTVYEEDIRYTCPWVLKIFCIEEIMFQRTAIINRLHLLFSEAPVLNY